MNNDGTKDQYTDDELIRGIKNRNDAVFEYMRRKFLPKIKAYFLSMKVCSSDIEDIFHDAILSVANKIDRNALNIEVSFENYFFGICKNKRRERSRGSQTKSDNINIIDMAAQNNINEIELEKEEKNDLVRRNILKITETCQQILQLRNNGLKFKEIARIMHYKSEGFARKKYWDYRNRLKSLIMKDPLYNILFDDDI